jgi:hypothetical protein
VTLRLDPGNAKARTQLQLVTKAVHEERAEAELPDIRRDGKRGYNAAVLGQARLRPLAPSAMLAYREAMHLGADGRKRLQNARLLAGPGREPAPQRCPTAPPGPGLAAFVPRAIASEQGAVWSGTLSGGARRLEHGDDGGCCCRLPTSIISDPRQIRMGEQAGAGGDRPDFSAPARPPARPRGHQPPPAHAHTVQARAHTRWAEGGRRQAGRTSTWTR